MRLSRLLLTAVVLTGLVSAAAVLAPRADAARAERDVARLLQAVARQDAAGFHRVVSPDAVLYSNFDVRVPATLPAVRTFLGPCQPLATVRTWRSIRVKTNCAMDAKGEFYIDFDFCRGKVRMISWPESGVWVSPPLWRAARPIVAGLGDVESGGCGDWPSSF